MTGVVHTAPRRHLSERQAEAVDHLVDAAAIEVASTASSTRLGMRARSWISGT